MKKDEKNMRKGERVKRRDREKGKRDAHTHKVLKPENDNHSQFYTKLQYECHTKVIQFKTKCDTSHNHTHKDPKPCE